MEYVKEEENKQWIEVNKNVLTISDMFTDSVNWSRRGRERLGIVLEECEQK